VRSRWVSVRSGCEIEIYVCVWKVGRAVESDGSAFAEGVEPRGRREQRCGGMGSEGRRKMGRGGCFDGLMGR
jgi:hypothetical protein